MEETYMYDMYNYYCRQCPYFLNSKFRQMTIDQARTYVRRYILSGKTNPTTRAFEMTMRTLNNNMLDQLAAYCDLLIRNFKHTIGPNAPGIPIATDAKRIILSSKKSSTI